MSGGNVCRGIFWGESDVFFKGLDKVALRGERKVIGNVNQTIVGVSEKVFCLLFVALAWPGRLRCRRAFFAEIPLLLLHPATHLKFYDARIAKLLTSTRQSHSPLT